MAGKNTYFGIINQKIISFKECSFRVIEFRILSEIGRDIILGEQLWA